MREPGRGVRDRARRPLAPTTPRTAVSDHRRPGQANGLI